MQAAFDLYTSRPFQSRSFPILQPDEWVELQTPAQTAATASKRGIVLDRICNHAEVARALPAVRPIITADFGGELISDVV
jgi:hypothetical protein